MKNPSTLFYVEHLMFSSKSKKELHSSQLVQSWGTSWSIEAVHALTGALML